MKKWLHVLLTISIIFVLAACGTGDKTKENDKNEGTKDSGKTAESKELIVGASNIPHAVILEQAVPLLKEKGYDLKIETFQDYVLPNTALDEGEIDANYFQHIPYLEGQIKEHGFDFVNAGGIHIEPIGVYSKKHQSLDDLPEGATILMSSSVADHGRILSMLEEEGLIELKEGINKVEATLDDIVKNPKKLVFNHDFEPAYLPKVYENDEGDAVLINSNFAIDIGLNPLKDAIAIEKKDSPYMNVIAVRKGNENEEKIKALVEVLQSEEIQQFILDEWNGAIVPVTEE